MNATNILLSMLGIAIALLMFGPGVVAALDGACWFLTNAQCTAVTWTDGRAAWAVVPWILLTFFALVGAS